jgi:CRISPR-associated protein (TIGR03984 family)
MSAKLFIYKASKLMKLADALKEFFTKQKENESAFALLYAPRQCYLALARKDGEGAKFFNAKGEIKPEEVEDVFEARVFNSLAELRWLNERDGAGLARALADAGDLKFFGDEPQPEKGIVGELPQQYLLWGKSAQASANGWTQFATARIGAFHVPVDGLSKGEFARFIAREYLREYEDGNVCVAQERLIGLETMKAKQEAKSNG